MRRLLRPHHNTKLSSDELQIPSSSSQRRGSAPCQSPGFVETSSERRSSYHGPSLITDTHPISRLCFDDKIVDGPCSSTEKSENIKRRSAKVIIMLCTVLGISIIISLYRFLTWECVLTWKFVDHSCEHRCISSC